MAPKKSPGRESASVWDEFIERVWDEGWTYIQSVVDIAREPMLILDKDLRIMSANEPFCRTFQVERRDAEQRLVYELANGQWDMPELRKLLEEVLPKNSFFKGYEIVHAFPFIGRKMLLLNARQMYFADSGATKLFPDITLLAFEDVTEIMSVAETLGGFAHELEDKLTERTDKLELHIMELEKKMKIDKTRK